MKRSILPALVLASSVVLSPLTFAESQTTESALILLNSADLQTQGMAMVLGNAMQGQGAQVDVLLCGPAGDLALKATENETLKPRDVTPEQLLMNLQKGGAKVEVCALYLPNSGNTEDALREGITPAAPPEVATKMLSSTKVFSF